ncbi:MAG: ATP-binding protein [Chloroflexi bacterium]|nr:ATP-binding protein [Chloroflexota bacterium]
MSRDYLAQALGFVAVRAGHNIRFMRADDFFKTLAQARVDHTLEKTFRSFLAHDLLILDDWGLHRLSARPNWVGCRSPASCSSRLSGSLGERWKMPWRSL